MTIYWSSTRNICCCSICIFCRYNIHNSYNFITLDDWSTSNTFQILSILTNTCVRIPNIIIFACMIIFTFTLKCLIILFLIWFHVVLLNLYLQSHETCFAVALDLFLSAILLNALTLMSFVSFGTHTFGEKALQLPVHLFN